MGVHGVLFACVHNAGRSRMAAAFFNALVERDDRPLPDPKGRPFLEVRAIRDDIRARVQMLVAERGWMV